MEPLLTSTLEGVNYELVGGCFKIKYGVRRGALADKLTNVSFSCGLRLVISIIHWKRSR